MSACRVRAICCSFVRFVMGDELVTFQGNAGVLSAHAIEGIYMGRPLDQGTSQAKERWDHDAAARTVVMAYQAGTPPGIIAESVDIIRVSPTETFAAGSTAALWQSHQDKPRPVLSFIRAMCRRIRATTARGGELGVNAPHGRRPPARFAMVTPGARRRTGHGVVRRRRPGPPGPRQ